MNFESDLTELQRQRWEQLFSMCLNNGMTEEEADAEAWEGLCEEWPELRDLGKEKP